MISQESTEEVKWVAWSVAWWNGGDGGDWCGDWKNGSGLEVDVREEESDMNDYCLSTE